METTKKRIEYVDLGAGILILWVIFFHAINNAHVFGETDARVALPFLTFSMPWFFYKSGSFFKASRGKAGLRKDFRKFIIPYIKWSLIGFAFYVVMMAVDGTMDAQHLVFEPWEKLSIYGYLPIDVPVWFILSLFFVRLIADGLLRIRIHPLVWSLIGVLLAYLWYLNRDLGLPVYLANIPMGLAFFMMGYSLKELETNHYVIGISLIVYIACLIWGFPIIGLHRNILLNGPFLLWPVSSYFCIVLFNFLCRKVCELICKWNIRFSFFRTTGRHAMDILITHGLIYMSVLHYSKLSPVPTLMIILASYALILPILIWVMNRKSRLSRL